MEQDTKNSTFVVAIAIDLSDHAEYAVKWYLEHIHKEGNSVCLVHVPESFQHTMISPGIVADLERESEKNVETMKQNFFHCFKETAGILPTFKLLHGKPGEAIMDFVKTGDVSLIVTGTRGQGTVRRTVMGSVSDYIVHHSPVPVLICRHKDPHKN